eukprot:gnl/Spiro4/12078_TR6371_c0_g1_i1.p1 gnl/Spiro4/12078_TR6371_c0_g1~~gnl/Spiro4/12078_TR6371_c0_g1_i1.p1  ORF type:complete len:364 (+),score=83.27 gnl/Spiro4/12078_TR6371_c0_g1_i1:110-1201(+)
MPPASVCVSPRESGCAKHLRALAVLALGQLISALITGTGITSQLLANAGVRIPTFQCLLNYLLLLFTFSIYFLASGQRPSIELWKYFLLAAADVEANYLVVKAYQDTAITSILLLDCVSIPITMVLSQQFLKAVYNRWHVGGVVCCLLGLFILVYHDWERAAPGTNPLRGDVFCLLGATLYAVSNVGQEGIVKMFSATEYLAMLGLFGSLINGVQLFALEAHELRNAADWRAASVIELVVFAAALYVMYVLVPVFLRYSSATLLNLSLLTSDIWGVVVGIVIWNFEPSVLYFVSLAMIMGGVALFNSTDLVYQYRELNSAEYQVMSTVVLQLDEDLWPPDAPSGAVNSIRVPVPVTVPVSTPV